MSRAILVFSFVALFVILIVVGVISIAGVSHQLSGSQEKSELNLYSTTINKVNFVIEDAEYSAYDTTSCLSDDLFVKGIVDLSFPKETLPNYCDVFVNDQHMKSITQIQRKCIEGCDENGMTYNIGVTFVKNTKNVIRACCDDLCIEESIDPLCPE